MKKAILILIVCSVSYGCDLGYSLVVPSSELERGNCPNRVFTFKLIRFLLGTNRTSELDGKFKLGEDSYWELDRHKRPIRRKGEFVHVFGGAMGSLPSWIRLVVRCGATGEITYDSGEVTLEKGFCLTKESRMYMLGGECKGKRYSEVDR